MSFEFWPAVAAGLIGGVVMTAMVMMMRMIGMPMTMNINRIWGTMAGVDGTAGQVVGFVIHLVISAAIALLYAAFFDWLGFDNNLWLWGLIGGAIHWAIAGVMLAILPAMHPRMPDELAAPGPFASNFGMPDVPGFLMGHLVYGVLVGIFYALLHSQGGSDIAF